MSPGVPSSSGPLGLGLLPRVRDAALAEVGEVIGKHAELPEKVEGLAARIANLERKVGALEKVVVVLARRGKLPGFGGDGKPRTAATPPAPKQGGSTG